MRTRNLVLFVLSLLVIVTLAVVLLEKTGVTNFYQKSAPNATQITPVNTVNYGAPTDEEAKAGDDIKEDLGDEEPDSQPEQSKEVPLTIVDAAQYGNDVEVRAFVSGVVKDGSCSFTFTQGQDVVEKSAPANADASTTPCMSQVIARSEFPNSGQWTLTIRYVSADETVSGSATATVEIQ